VLLTMDNANPMAGELWQALSGQLRAFIRRRVRSDTDADDVLQDVFVQVVEKIGSVRQADRIQSWVFQIARNAVVDSYRRQNPRPSNAVEDVADSFGTNENLNAAIGNWLSSMIAMLPSTLRDAVRLYEIEGWSQLEIADQLGISLSAAKSRVQRARGKLGELLQSHCEVELDRRGNVLDCKPKRADGCGPVSCECTPARSLQN
jgi:RNA polymerase sigma-70 factor (ECF subfamily)